MNINCLEVINQLSAYMDHDVPSELRHRIREHLADCKHCTAVFDGMRNVVRDKDTWIVWAGILVEWDSLRSEARFVDLQRQLSLSPRS